jgi:hypothetical protein
LLEFLVKEGSDEQGYVLELGLVDSGKCSLVVSGLGFLQVGLYASIELGIGVLDEVVLVILMIVTATSRHHTGTAPEVIATPMFITTILTSIIFIHLSTPQ